VVRVKFHGLLADHVCGLAGVSQSLGFHDSLHVGGPAVFSGDEDTWAFFDSGSDDDFLYFVSEDFLDELAERFERGLLLFVLFLLVFGLFEV